MLFNTVTASLLLVASVSAASEFRKPYKARSPNSLLLAIRQNTGYQPETSVCSDGNTCAEACGAGYDQCASTDSAFHCYNPAAGELCCDGIKGDSCEAGFYCTRDAVAETWCCPDDLDLEACAREFNVGSALESLVPVGKAPAPTSSAAPAPPPAADAPATAPETPVTTAAAEEVAADTTSTSDCGDETHATSVPAVTEPETPKTTVVKATTSSVVPVTTAKITTSITVPLPNGTATKTGTHASDFPAAAANNQIALVLAVGIFAALL